MNQNGMNGINISSIHRFAIQILGALNFLKKHKIIHCDLKPQNILLKQAQKSGNRSQQGIKIIDFGSSCFCNNQVYKYIQSRYYRAPQTIFQFKYDTMIDMWSLGCIIAQLYLGTPLFPGDSQPQLIFLISQTIGPIPQQMFSKIKSHRKNVFFTEQTNNLKFKQRRKGFPYLYKPLKQIILQADLCKFLQRILVWQPQKRMSPGEGLQDGWILSLLPKDIICQHLKCNKL